MRYLLLTLLLFSFHSLARVKPGSVVYGVVPCLFGNDCLNSVTKKLEYLKEQGVDILWISPIYETDDNSLISYATTDYLKIRPDFGNEEDFRKLVSRAHQLGLKVILDFVPNHTSDKHPFFIDAKLSGTKSPYYSFFERDENGNYTFYFDWVNLPNLNFSNPKVRDYIARAFLHWIEKFNVDGFRVDAAWGIRERNPDFWPLLNRKLKQKKHDIILLAEAGARDSYYFSNGFDFAYDWTENLGEWSWNDVFQFPESAPDRLHKAILSSQNVHQVARFINNNDTGRRFITRFGTETTKLAALIQHTVPGLPVVYMGDELGAEFDPYEDPAPLSWRGRFGLKQLYQKLALLRETVPALHSGDFKRIPVSAKAVYAFKRKHQKSEVMVLTNFSSRSYNITLPTSELQKLKLQDLLTGKAVSLKQGSLLLKAKEGLILSY